MSRRIFALAVLLSSALSGQATTKLPQPSGTQQQLGVLIPMRGGIRLAADLFLPRGSGPWPTLLLRTPYNRHSPGVRGYRMFTQRGYAVLVQDIRGRYESPGIFGSTQQQGQDGNDTINWIAQQAWSNRRVVMAGGSYLGIVQWWAAIQDNPHLFAISPVFSGDDEYLDRFYSTGGALKLGHRLLWMAENFAPPPQARRSFSSYIGHLPLRTSDVAATGFSLPLWRNALDHPSYDPYWKSLSIRERMNRVAVPVLSFGGWFDNYAESDLDAFSRLARQGRVIETWIGPWAHNPGLKFSTVDFGPEAAIGLRTKQLEWFDRWVKTGPRSRVGGSGPPLLHLFVMGQNVWREEHEWPLARTQFTPIYLTSRGDANTASGDGGLRWEPVRKARADHFIYDPNNPVPTRGGAICCEPTILRPGPLDQTSIEGRRDILVYTSAPLMEDLEVTGPVHVVLYARTSANDTDFTAKLVDVQPSGHALLVTDGIQRLRYRLSLAEPVFVKRNTPYQISIDAGVTSYMFAARHRIRLEISSSNFPRFDRNLNSTRPNAIETKTVVAQQTVYHEKGYPSAIILPVIPKSSSIIPARSR
ncbi:MAG: CocE/NonD family hydrolase [Acidobacteriaceae bacterium]|nr:CocE/NonD family hydrolase [Acidobacteriaceae bacterium]MBV9780653.1 CocE/NonD family hydrolase [Acidobacteriaceae bacterium]